MGRRDNGDTLSGVRWRTCPTRCERGDAFASGLGTPGESDVVLVSSRRPTWAEADVQVSVRTGHRVDPHPGGGLSAFGSAGTVHTLPPDHRRAWSRLVRRRRTTFVDRRCAGPGIVGGPAGRGGRAWSRRTCGTMRRRQVGRVRGGVPRRGGSTPRHRPHRPAPLGRERPAAEQSSTRSRPRRACRAGAVDAAGMRPLDVGDLRSTAGEGARRSGWRAAGIASPTSPSTADDR